MEESKTYTLIKTFISLDEPLFSMLDHLDKTMPMRQVSHKMNQRIEEYKKHREERKLTEVTL
jgi:hypothetical protein